MGKERQISFKEWKTITKLRTLHIFLTLYAVRALYTPTQRDRAVSYVIKIVVNYRALIPSLLTAKCLASQAKYSPVSKLWRTTVTFRRPKDARGDGAKICDCGRQ